MVCLQYPLQRVKSKPLKSIAWGLEAAGCWSYHRVIWRPTIREIGCQENLMHIDSLLVCSMSRILYRGKRAIDRWQTQKSNQFSSFLLMSYRKEPFPAHFFSVQNAKRYDTGVTEKSLSQASCWWLTEKTLSQLTSFVCRTPKDTTEVDMRATEVFQSACKVCLAPTEA